MSNITKSAVVALIISASAPAFAGGVTTANQSTTAPASVVTGAFSVEQLDLGIDASETLTDLSETLDEQSFIQIILAAVNAQS